MKVIVAGYNVDTAILDALAGSKKVVTTPETISAAYARISRSAKSATALRTRSRQEVDEARKSNRTIIFKMGHHSVAEHAVFNFDIIGVSRLALEEIEKFRLNSYTEKSQRYVGFKGDFAIPDEIKSADFKNEFAKTAELQIRFYHQLQKTVDNEDARYSLPLTMKSQLGATINARSLELMLRRFASHRLAEIRTLGKRLYQSVARIAPSIILFSEANDFDRHTYPELRSLVSNFEFRNSNSSGDVELVSYTPHGDDITVAVLLHTSSRRQFRDCLNFVATMAFEKKLEVIKTAFQHLELYDAVLREFEYVQLVYELRISAAGFAQLKRHRLLTMTAQPYDPNLGITIPGSVRRAGMDKKFNEIIGRTETIYDKIYRQTPDAAPYILTNSHRRRVLVGVNGRELYHISRLREDTEAQWDIRAIAQQMVERAKQVMPLTFLFIGGKDRYPKIYEEIFGRAPKVVKAELPGARKID
jgi:flavin-dependent thymidylate synthase